MQPNAAFDYCLKPESRKGEGKTGRSDGRPNGAGGGGWDGLVARTKEGGSWSELIREFPRLYATYPGGVRRLYEFNSGLVEQPIKFDGIKSVILYGPPGTGKTTSVRGLIDGRPFYRLTHGKWFGNYGYERILWIDDFQPKQMVRAWLLQLMESGRLLAEEKGGHVTVDVDEVYITSNYHPNEWYPEQSKKLAEERGDAILRRADVQYVTAEGVSGIESLCNTTRDSVKRNQDSILAHFGKKAKHDE